MTDVTAKKWEEVFADREFARELLQMSIEDSVKALTDKGYDFTIEDVNEAATALRELAQHVNADGELDEAMLQEIAGGSVGSHVGSFLAGVGSVAIAAAGGIAIGMLW